SKKGIFDFRRLFARAQKSESAGNHSRKRNGKFDFQRFDKQCSYTGLIYIVNVLLLQEIHRTTYSGRCYLWVMVKKAFKISLLLVFFIIGIMLYSYISPGTLSFMDNIRMRLQAPVMERVGDMKIGDVYLKDGLETEGPRDMTLDEIEPYLKKFKPATVFFTNSRRYISSEFIPGQWKHSVIYLGTREQVENYFGENCEILDFLAPYYSSGNEYLILDSNADGVQIREFDQLSNLNEVSVLNSMIGFSINRPKPQKKQFLQYAFGQLGKPYDYDLRSDDSTNLYCSELVKRSLKSIGIEITTFSQTIGRTITSPDDLVRYIIHTGIDQKEFELLVYLKKERGVVYQESIKY
ncbi:MAG: YiiX/YebB-like N1pC/P60 family cysteine hydrolase, partial [Bacteroidales bacterium]